jgi:hypothetical protein
VGCDDFCQKNNLKQKIKNWKRLSSDEKSKVRDHFKNFSNLPQNKKNLRKAYQNFKSLPVTEQDKLLSHFYKN